jgi:hypothetical protein
MKGLKRIVSCSATLMLMSLTANADPLTTMDEVAAAIVSCWKPPAGVKKSTVTLSFGLKSDGSLIGPPQSTFIDVAGDEKARQQFIAAAMDAWINAHPLNVSRLGPRDRGSGIHDGICIIRQAANRAPAIGACRPKCTAVLG